MIKDPGDYAVAITVGLQRNDFEEITAWLMDNIHNEWVYTFGQVCFRHEEDAIIFRLRFGL